MAEWTRRQQDIINAALDIISTGGIGNLTIKTLAAAVNVTEGALYRHFKSKEDILAAIAVLFDRGSTDILNHIMASSRSGIEKLKDFFLGRCRQFSENRGLVLVMFSEDVFRGHDALLKQVHRTIHSHKALLVQAINDAREQGIIRDIPPEHVFMVVMGALRLLVTRWRGANFSFDLSSEGERLWTSMETLIRR